MQGYLNYVLYNTVLANVLIYVERGSSSVECRTRNRVSPGSNPPLLPLLRLGILEM